MPPRPRTPKPPPPPKPWRREDGHYRSADERFTIDGGGAGRWFLTDEATTDELGLARTLGPYATLDDAKAVAAERREGADEASPLAALLEAAKDRPARSTARSKSSRGASSRDESSGDVAVTAEPEPPAPPPTWLDALAVDDPRAAAHARRLVEQLDALGVEDADGLVRRDVLGRQPAIATALLARTIAAGLRDALDSDGTAGVDRQAIDRAVAAVLAVVSGREGASGQGRDLPGWRLVERPASRDGDVAPRRIIVTREDVARG